MVLFRQPFSNCLTNLIRRVFLNKADAADRHFGEVWPTASKVRGPWAEKAWLSIDEQLWCVCGRQPLNVFIDDLNHIFWLARIRLLACYYCERLVTY